MAAVPAGSAQHDGPFPSFGSLPETTAGRGVTNIPASRLLSAPGAAGLAWRETAGPRREWLDMRGEMKHCPCCGETKPLKDFYRCKSRGDGHTGFCKICHELQCQATRRRDPEKYREINRRTARKHRARTVIATRAKWAAIAAEAAAGPC